MPQQSQRRSFLTGLGTASLVGLAGCIDRVQEQFDGTDGTDDAETGAGDEIQTSDDGSDEHENGNRSGNDEQPLHSGETIPAVPYEQTNSEPLNPRPDPAVDNPVLTAADVTDVDASFVASPFLFVEDDEWHMFFEIQADGRARIGHASSPDAGTTWEYEQVVLNLRQHVSYPHVFKWEGEYYMTVQSSPSDSPVRLYTANSFPHEWYGVAELYDPGEYDHGITDHSLFYWDDRWWSLGGGERGSTYLYSSDTLTASNWEPHDDNPVVRDRPDASRPGGRPIVRDDDVLVFFQSLVGGYGMAINAYRITDLTTSTYEDVRHPASPILRGSDELDADGTPTWNAHRMHHYDPWYLGPGEGWRVAVDGDDGTDDWQIGIYRVQE